jgi:hypothetical protein
MRKLFFAVLIGFVMNVTADEISLFDWGLNINGRIISSRTDLPANAAFSDGFFETGLGTITLLFDAEVATGYSAAFLDYEIDEHGNTFYNEYGVIGGTSDDPRLSYEIDEPGFGNGAYTGDIYDNFVDFQTGGFDEKVFYDGNTGKSLSELENPVSDDVSMAMGWRFTLNDNEKACVEYTVSTSQPTSGLYLAQIDQNKKGTAIYMQSKLKSTAVPEPGIMSLLGISLSAFGLMKRLKRRNR